jgi:SAM-dependent methyltransferase
VQEYQRLRTTFDEDAERYHRRRPGYPPPLFDDLAAAGAGPGARVLEIGCGTGQATVSLVERGYRVLAVELGPAMADYARRLLPDVEVVTGAFEEWPLPDEPFDVVFSATAFHWIDPAVRVAKAAQALRPGGLLATVATQHVLGGTVDFFAQAQDCYERWDPATPPGLRLLPADEIPTDAEDVRPWFAAPTFHRYERDIPSTTAEYLDLLQTYSGHIALPQPQRDGLLSCIGALIDGGYGGRVVKRYLTELRLARRL